MVSAGSVRQASVSSENARSAGSAAESENQAGGSEIGPVVKLPGQSGARIGVMLGADGYGPETTIHDRQRRTIPLYDGGRPIRSLLA